MIDIVDKFKIKGKVLNIVPYANGLVNKTYLVVTTDDKYLLQRINNYVFKDPPKLMDNIEKVTNHLKHKHCLTLSIIKTKDHKSYYYDEHNKAFYRIYQFLDGLYTLPANSFSQIYLEIGKAIGSFQSHFYDFDWHNLVETIPNFHNTPQRIKKLDEAFKTCSNINRLTKSKKVYEYIMKNTKEASIIQTKYEKGLIPKRITHNDTKLNNILFDKEQEIAVCLIDLDTVMPGIAIFDFGDAVRAACSTKDENSSDFLAISLDTKKVIQLMAGYLGKMYQTLNKVEINLLINAIGTIILECSSRFLTDYLENDLYFKVLYDEHNLIRATNQVYLHIDYMKKKKFLNDITKQMFRRMIAYF